MSDSWGAFEDALNRAKEVQTKLTNSSLTNDIALKTDLLAEALEQGEAVKGVVADMLKAIKADIVFLAPQTVGDHTLDGVKYEIGVEIGERLSWDSEKLAEIAAASSGDLDEIEAKYGIPAKAYEAMTASDRAAVAPALTIKQSAPKLKITRKN